MTDKPVDDAGNTVQFKDVIQMVAAANEHQNDFTEPSELPELRASPCQMHQRDYPQHQHQHQQHQRLPNSSHLNHPAHTPRNKPVAPMPLHSPSKGTVSPGTQGGLDSKTKQNERLKPPQEDPENEQNLEPATPKLPQVMTSKEFVKSWLIHGSQPIGQSHFPDVTTQKPTNRKAPARVVDKKQTLAPIFRTLKAKKQRELLKKQ